MQKKVAKFEKCNPKLIANDYEYYVPLEQRKKYCDKENIQILS